MTRSISREVISPERMRAFKMMRRLSIVPRWAVVQTTRKQSVAEHSYGVALFSTMLLEVHARGKEPAFRLEVLEYSIEHDKEESVTGDVPSPSKQSKAIDKSDQVRILVKCADLLEAMAFMYEEILLGNMYGTRETYMWLAEKLSSVWADFEWSQKCGTKISHRGLSGIARKVSFDRAAPHPYMF